MSCFLAAHNALVLMLTNYNRLSGGTAYCCKGSRSNRAFVNRLLPGQSAALVLVEYSAVCEGTVESRVVRGRARLLP